MRPLALCLVGYGGIAEFHADACKQIDGIELRTLMGRRREPAEEFAGRHGFSRVTTSLDEALADGDLDAVILTSPSEVHHEQAMACLDAGVHVLVEIPLAMSLAGAQLIAQRAAQVECNVMVAHTRRFDDVGRFVKEFLASGKAGRRHRGVLGTSKVFQE